MGIWHWFSDWLDLKALMAMFPLAIGTQTGWHRVTNTSPTVLSVVTWSQVPTEHKGFG